MATITIAAGAISRSIQIQNAKLSAVVDLVVAAKEGPTSGTTAQKTDFVLEILRQYLQEIATGERRKQAVETAASLVVVADLSE